MQLRVHLTSHDDTINCNCSVILKCLQTFLETKRRTINIAEFPLVPGTVVSMICHKTAETKVCHKNSSSTCLSGARESQRLLFVFVLPLLLFFAAQSCAPRQFVISRIMPAANWGSCLKSVIKDIYNKVMEMFTLRYSWQYSHVEVSPYTCSFINRTLLFIYLFF